MSRSHTPWSVAGAAVALAISTLAISAVAVPVSALCAQSAGDTTLTLAGALAHARASSPALRVIDARRDAAVGRLRETGQFPNPTLEWRRENLGSPLPPDIFATLSIPVDITGRRLALRSATARGTERASADAVADRHDTEVRVARAWLRAASAHEQRQAALVNVETLNEIATVDSVRAREGQVAVGVALRTRLEADRARATLAAFDGDAARALTDLARALGVSVDALRPVAAISAPPLPPAPDTIVSRRVAARTRPELLARDAAVREAESRATAEQRGILSDVQLQGGSKQTSGFLTGQIGVLVPVPAFHRNDGARQRTRGELAEARAMLDETRIGVHAEVLAAQRNYEAVRSVAREAQSFAARGREIALITRTAYREGHATLSELLEAERAAAEATSARLRWLTDAWLARLELERALGARLDADSLLDLPLLASIPMEP